MVPRGPANAGATGLSIPTGAKGRRAEQRWQSIVDTAAEVFFEKGYAASTMQDVADSVGILSGSLYYYVRTKEDLLFHVIKQAHDGIDEHMKRCQALEADPLVILRALLEGHVLFNIAHLREAAAFIAEFRSLSEPFKAPIVEQRDAYERYVRDLLTEGQRLGLVRAELDASVSAKAMLGMLNSLHLWYRPGGQHPPAQIAKTFASTVLDGATA